LKEINNLGALATTSTVPAAAASKTNWIVINTGKIFQCAFPGPLVRTVPAAVAGYQSSLIDDEVGIHS
jgi:hypothetical protein